MEEVQWWEQINEWREGGELDGYDSHSINTAVPETMEHLYQN